MGGRELPISARVVSDQPMHADQFEDICLFFFSSNEGGQGGCQVVRRGRCFFRQFPQARLLGKFQQALHPLGLMIDVQRRHKQSHERPCIRDALILFETADLRIAVPDLNGELAAG